jgi:membrane-associated phospholipid phosphatase
MPATAREQPEHRRFPESKFNNSKIFHLTMAMLALSFVAVSIVGLYYTNIEVQPRQFISKSGVLLSLLLAAAFYRWRGEEKLFNLITIVFWSLLFGSLHLLPMFVASRTGVELKDELLAGFDRAMGIEVPRVVGFVRSIPALNGLLTWCYGSLLFLMTAALMLPPLCGKMRAAKEFAVASVVSAMISLPLFAVLQALGPWTYYDYRPSIDHSSYLALFSKLRSDGPFTLDLSYRDGLITFPSFHTILAVLASAALFHIRYVRWPATCVGILIVISTVTTGTHYVIDVYAGIGIAFVSVLVARVFSRIEQDLEEGTGEFAGRRATPSRLADLCSVSRWTVGSICTASRRLVAPGCITRGRRVGSMLVSLLTSRFDSHELRRETERRHLQAASDLSGASDLG